MDPVRSLRGGRGILAGWLISRESAKQDLFINARSGGKRGRSEGNIEKCDMLFIRMCGAISRNGFLKSGTFVSTKGHAYDDGCGSQLLVSAHAGEELE